MGNSTLNGYPASAINHGITSAATVAKELGGTWRTGMNMQSITKTMLDLENGSTGVIFGARSSGQVGHFFNVVNKNGVIQFLDFEKKGTAIMAESEVNQYYQLWFLDGTLK